MLASKSIRMCCAGLPRATASALPSTSLPASLTRNQHACGVPTTRRALSTVPSGVDSLFFSPLAPLSTLVPAAARIEPESFLVSHPMDEARDVYYVLKVSEAHGVLMYKVPDDSDTPHVTAASSLAPATLLSAQFRAMPGEYDTRAKADVLNDIDLGKFVVANHSDPWSVINGYGLAPPYDVLIQTLGGPSAAMPPNPPMF